MYGCSCFLPKSIYSLVRYDASYSASRINQVSLVPWNKVYVKMHNRLPGIFSTVYPHIVGIRLVLFVKIFLAPVNKLPELLLFLLAGLKIIPDVLLWYYQHVSLTDRKDVKYGIGRFALNYDLFFFHVAKYAAQIITRPFLILKSMSKLF